MSDKKMADRSSMIKTSILIFVCSGFWCPMWFSARLKFAYKFYTSFAISLIFSFMITQLINIIVNVNNVTELVNNCLTFIPTINAFCKGINLLAKREKIIHLLRMLVYDRCNGQDYHEINIQRKYESLCKWINAIITINTIVTLNIMVFRPILKNYHARILPFQAWLPYTPETEFIFWSSFIWEGLSAITVGLTNLANDLLAISIMMQISGQLDILAHRLINMVKVDTKMEVMREDINGECASMYCDGEKRIREKLVHCVHHHIFIFKLAEETQECLVLTFAGQMLVSLIGTCTGAYQLARSSIGSADFTAAVLFVGCMISEAFLYCWFGNEVNQKSIEVGNAVYTMDWTSLKIELRKDLLNVCMRASQPILFTSGPAMPLSNEFFVSILQASYTAFTVLREISVKPSSLS